MNIVGYLRISIRKCDESEPTFGYTFDYNSFIKKDFSFNNLLEADPKFEFFVKANRIGTLYLNLKSDAEPSLLSVKVEFSSEKVKKDSIKPGNKGQIDYVLLDSSQAKMSFSSAVCSQQ